MRLQRLVYIFVLLCLLAAGGIVPVMAQDTTHIIQPGENLFRIALRYGVDVEALAAANNITNENYIYAGQTLIVPVPVPAQLAAAPQTAPAEAAAPVEDAGIIDSSVLDQPALEPETAAVSEAVSESVEVAEAAESVEAAAPAESVEPVYHVVGRGQTLASIAQSYGLTAETLAEMNDLINPDMIYAGQRLVVGSETVVETEADTLAQTTTEATTHVVQQGESLGQIAQQYGVSWLAIAQANNIFDPNRVLVGDALVIPGAGGGSDLGIVDVPAAPAAAVAAGRSIIVDISDARIYAYEDGVLMRNVLVSTGLPATPTVQGEFSIRTKYAAQTMSGPGYYLPDVPWVMYFYGGYAVHGAYWHDNWGVPMSHGCVNLPIPEAEWFYNFAPEGTPILVQF